VSLGITLITICQYFHPKLAEAFVDKKITQFKNKNKLVGTLLFGSYLDFL